MVDSPNMTHRLRVTRLSWEAEGVIAIELRALDGAALAPFTAGAHIDLKIPNGLVRSYSLQNDPAETDRYVVGVGLDAKSRGGSTYLHNNLRVGQIIEVLGPRNHFALVEDAPLVVLIGGGIGITPLCAMARRLTALGRPYALHYAVRSADRAAFAADLRRLNPAGYKPHVDADAGGPLDMTKVIAAYPASTHFYCCGPAPMLAAFEQATAALPPAQVHVEYFTAKEVAKPAVEQGFTVVAALSGREFRIPPERSILDVLTEGGIEIASSCQDGICGSCETKVIEGTPDHRDSVLTAAEQDANNVMMVCVSRCRGDKLVLDV